MVYHRMVCIHQICLPYSDPDYPNQNHFLKTKYPEALKNPVNFQQAGCYRATTALFFVSILKFN